MSDDKLIRVMKSLPLFAKNFLQIRTKSGRIEPFHFNRAQEYLHNRLETQLDEFGRVRALVLKGRQMGSCFSEDMRVLTSRYEWIKIKDVRVGDSLFSVDEDPIGLSKSGRKTDRKIRIATVEAKVSFKKPAFEVCLSSGVKLKVTGDHRMMFKQRGGCMTLWRSIDAAIVGDFIRSFCPPPNNDKPSYEDGWFSGLLDGEGSFGCYPGARIAISQVDGDVLNRCKKYLSDRNIKYYELIDNRKADSSSKYGDKPVHCIRIDRQADIIRIISMCRPSRFVGRTEFVGRSLPNSCEGFEAWAKIESITPIGEIHVVDLQTSEKTYICEGLVSHNSTYVGARFFHKVCTTQGKKAFILTHEAEATKNLFDMTKRYYDSLPLGLVPVPDASSAKELNFKTLNSGYSVGTAGNKAVGRSQTIQLMHASEVAYYPHAEDHAKGILQAVSNEPGTEIIMESTANGIGNYFYNMWMAAIGGQSDFQAIFVPWYWQNEYISDAREGDTVTLTEEERELLAEHGDNGLTIEHLYWRRRKLLEFSNDFETGRELFNVEYPFTALDAFRNPVADRFIKANLVNAARKRNVESHSQLVIGIDPAITDHDRTAVIRRKGRLVYGLDTHFNLNTMEIVGLVRRIIDKECPAKVCIDCIGIGAGIVDRLHELGYEQVEGVNVARSASDKDKFKNLRAELWHDMREWLAQDMPVQIPDSDELLGDLTSLGYKFDSSGRLQIESKDDLRRRGMKSPDCGDALSLTYFVGDFVSSDNYHVDRISERASSMLI